MTLTPTTANVLAVYSRASVAQITSGMNWYSDAHNFALSLDADIRKGAGVIAALSVMNHWNTNKDAATKAFANGTAFGTHTVPNEVKADAILAGADPLDILGGNKVRAFYATIVDPTGHSIPVIDRHAFDVAVGKVCTDKERGILSRKGVFAEFGQAYIDAAVIAGIGAPQMQAITWETWRDEKGIWK